MDTTLAFDHVWKRFRKGAVHDSLREVIPALVRKISGKQNKSELGERDFWALTDLSFEVKPGEVLGIIGGNGAGKSTTLKILNELMEPTKGRVQIRGKIGSLIEVSAGFHQDLTGRQNVYLQGSIMGMKKAEVVRKFDQIVEFAGVSEFIDTPVKRYSSGMNARLGFSIAAHLEPDVLIIDEVLAVGDFAFQQRAFAKIKTMATSGIPVVLVSHQLDRIQELCTEVILLEKGKVKTKGSAAHCINMYLHPPETETSQEDVLKHGIRLDSIHALNGVAIPSGEHLSLLLTGEAFRDSYPYEWQIATVVRNATNGQEMHVVHSATRGVPFPKVSGKFEHRIDLQMNLQAGNYIITTAIIETDTHRTIVKGPQTSVEVLQNGKYSGAAQLNLRWTDVTSSGLSAVAKLATPGSVDVPIFEEPTAVEELAPTHAESR